MNSRHGIATALAVAGALVSGCAAPATTAPAPAAPAGTPAAPASTAPTTGAPAPTQPAAAPTHGGPCTWLTAEQVQAALGERSPKGSPLKGAHVVGEVGGNGTLAGCMFPVPATVGPSLRAYRMEFRDEAAAKKTMTLNGQGSCAPVSDLGAETVYCTAGNAESWAKVLQSRTGTVVRQVVWFNGPQDGAAQAADLQGPLTTLFQQTRWPDP